MTRIARNCFFAPAVAVALLTGAAADMSLNGDWRLDYFPQPDVGAVRELPLVGVDFKTVTAKVPGNCELDLVRAGVLPTLEKGLNVLKLRPFEGYQWLYTRSFALAEAPAAGRAMLVFDGIDTLADVFLNGKKIGEADNMFIPHRFDVTRALKKGTNVVQVLLRSVAIEAQYKSVGEIGYSPGPGDTADVEPFRKSIHAGGWDIGPRVYVSGLWRDVTLKFESDVRIDEAVWIPCSLDLAKKTARVDVRFRVQAPFSRLDRMTWRLNVSRDGKSVGERRRPCHAYQNAYTGMALKDVEFWWPKGFGAQPLYDATIELLDDATGRVLAKDSRKIGIRTVALERDDVYSTDPKGRNGEFVFRVNGAKVFIRGTNWVPTDAIHGRDPEHLDRTLGLLDDVNCNMVRVWGGGVYEPDRFFDWCDRKGVLVWQDFMFACSVYPQDDDFADKVRAEVLDVVLRMRNHPSLAIWCGNNENDRAFAWRTAGEYLRDPNDDRISRQVIPSVLFDRDVSRPYLPSSPYYSRDVFAKKARSPEEHLWLHRPYFKDPFYIDNVTKFISETGYHGCPNRDSIERMCDAETVYPWKDGVNGKAYDWNDEWRLKACNAFLDRTCRMLWSRPDFMLKGCRLMFGEVPRELDDFIAASQIVQAEAFKTFAEVARSRKFERSGGLIWWNLRDMWPQMSDAVVDYYFGKKWAYHVLANVQRDQVVLVCEDGTVLAVNDTRQMVRGQASVVDRVTGKKLLDCDYEVPVNGKTSIGKVSWSGQGVLDISFVQGGEKGVNWYLYGQPTFGFRKVCEWMKPYREKLCK